MSQKAASRGIRIPAPVRLARGLLVLVAVSHLAVPVVMWTDQGALSSKVAGAHPGFSAAEVATTVHSTLIVASAFHGIFLLLCLLLAWKLPTARPWTRRLTTITQLLSVLFSAVSWSSSPMFHPVIPFIDAAEVVIVALLWGPRPARAFFSTAQSSSGAEPRDPRMA